MCFRKEEGRWAARCPTKSKDIGDGSRSASEPCKTPDSGIYNPKPQEQGPAQETTLSSKLVVHLWPEVLLRLVVGLCLRGGGLFFPGKQRSVVARISWWGSYLRKQVGQHKTRHPPPCKPSPSWPRPHRPTHKVNTCLLQQANIRVCSPGFPRKGSLPTITRRDTWPICLYQEPKS